MATLTPALALAADRPPATLRYEREPGRVTSECPDEATFRALVAAKLGYEPFAPEGPTSMRVVFRRSNSELSGTLTLGLGGIVLGERTLRAASGDCDELAASLALAAAVAIDPDAAARPTAPAIPARAAEAPAPTAAAAPRPPPPPPAPVAPKDNPPAPAAVPSAQGLGPRFALGVFVPWGLTPSVTAGARLGVGLDADTWLVGLEGSATLESSKEVPLGTVTAQLFDAAVVPCIRPTVAPRLALALCAVARFGVLSSNAEGVTRPAPQTDLVALLGPRAGLELFPWPAFGFGIDAEMPISFTRVHLLLDDHGQQQEIWASNRIGMMGALTMIFRPR